MSRLQNPEVSRRDIVKAGGTLPPLTLRRAVSFWARLRGLHGLPCLPWHTGLYLSPCRAVHSFGMRYAIDVVFLCADGKSLKQVSNMLPGRVAFCLRAASAIELPGGYCLAYPAYESAIERCLHPRCHGHHHGLGPDSWCRTR